MHHQRQTNQIGSLSRQIKPSGFISAPFCQIRCAANFNPHDHIPMSLDDASDGIEIAITQVVQFSEQRRIAHTAD